jgi:PAS domain S-box-containing protein
MKDENKTKRQLIGELVELRRRITELEAAETKRKRAEGSLQLFKAIVEASSEAIAISDSEGQLVYINPAHEKLFGRSLEEARQMNYRDYYPPESLEILNRDVAPVLARGESWEGELDVLDANGRRFPLWERADSLRDAEGKMLYGFSLMHDVTERKRMEEELREHRDHLEKLVEGRTAELVRANEQLQREITERKRAEQALRESEESYRELADSITDVFFAMDQYLRYTYWNKASESLTGIRAEDALGKSLLEVFPDTPWVRRAEKVYRDVLRTQQPQTFVNDTDLGGRHYVFEISAYPSRSGISVFVKDITERKRAEQALQASERRFRALTENSADGIALLDAKGAIRYESPTNAQALGYSVGELVGTNIFELMHPDDIQSVSLLLSALVEKPETPLTIQFRFRHKDGSWCWLEATGNNLLAESAVQAIVVNYRDITERKRAEQALRESEERFRHFSAVAFEAIVIHEGGIIISANDQYCEMFGYEPEEFMGKHALPLTVAPEAMESIKRETATGGVGPYESIGLKKDGTRFPIEIRVREWEYEGRKVRVAAIMDITERKQAEEALRESEEKYKSIFELVPTSIVVFDSDGTIVDINPNHVSQIGGGKVTREDYIGMNVLTHPSVVKAGLSEMYKQVLEEGKPIDEEALHYPSVTRGSHGYFNVRGVPLRKDEEVIGAIFIHDDITEDKWAEQALRESEESYRELADSITEVFFAMTSI